MGVATVLTVYGIETFCKFFHDDISFSLQQYLPFTVLKLYSLMTSHTDFFNVATVLTVYGIETFIPSSLRWRRKVATVLTVYGIETANLGSANTAHSIPLQQYLSFTVLKLIIFRKASNITTSCNSTYRLRY